MCTLHNFDILDSAYKKGDETNGHMTMHKYLHVSNKKIHVVYYFYKQYS